MRNHSFTGRGVDDAPLLELDLRELPAPEPMLRALAATDALLPGQSVQVLTPMLPTPLLDMLQGRGLRVVTELLADGGASVLIRCPSDDDQAAA